MGKLSKAKSLTKVEKAAIDGFLINGMTHDEISRALDREISKIDDYVEKRSQELEQEKATKELLVHNTKNNRGGVTIMTESASYKNNGANPNGNKSNTRGNRIHKIRK